MPIYLDCASTTPVDPRVRDLVFKCLDEEFGNAGSRTHEFGQRARRLVEHARDQVAAAVGAGRGEVLFTSGATESDNLALLGLAAHGRHTGKTHLISSQIEHPAVLEPLRFLAPNGFDLTLLPPTPGGWIDPEAVRDALRPQTLLVSIMHANNETGVLQPITDIARALEKHDAFFHVDAAQSFGREIEPLKNPRLDLISISGHKIHAPKGVGALVVRRRGHSRPPLAPLMLGGGQELGLRPGTLSVPLIAALGLAAELAVAEQGVRRKACLNFRAQLLEGLKPLHPILNGDQASVLPHIISVSFPDIASEAVIEALKDEVAISEGSACSSQSEACSPVLAAMNAQAAIAQGATRWSWFHGTELPRWDRIQKLLGAV